MLNAAISTRARRASSGRDVLGSGKRFDLEVRLGAGAYICGEETSMLESLEGKRGEVRVRPPLPADQGPVRRATVVNNVITLATVPVILAAARRPTATSGRRSRAARCRSSLPATSGVAAWSSALSA